MSEAGKAEKEMSELVSSLKEGSGTLGSSATGDAWLGSPLSGTNGQLMVMAAYRYCLGRSSYIGESCQEWLRAWWPLFDAGTREVMVRDTIEALMDDCMGNEWNRARWKGFAEWGWERLTVEQQESCWRALEWKCKAWPLSSATAGVAESTG